MPPTELPPARADALAALLDLDVMACGIRHACLSFVSFALDRGDPGDVARQTRRMTPDLWAEGLAAPVLAALRSARDAGVADAAGGLADAERRGGRSGIARAVVRRLAADLSRRTRTELRLEALARPQLDLAPPGLN